MGTPVGLKVRKLEAPEQIRTTAVSPMPRAMARITAVASPVPALGEDDLPRRPPPGRAQGLARLAQAGRHDPERHLGRPGDDRGHGDGHGDGDGDAGLRQPELDDEEDVDEEAGQDLGEGGHRLDHGAHQRGALASDLVQVDRSGDAQRNGDRHRDADLNDGADDGMEDPTLGEWRRRGDPCHVVRIEVDMHEGVPALDERVDDRAAEGEEDDGGRDVERRGHEPLQDDEARVGHRQDHGVDGHEGQVPAHEEADQPAEVQDVQVADGDQREGGNEGADERDHLLAGERPDPAGPLRLDGRIVPIGPRRGCAAVARGDTWGGVEDGHVRSPSRRRCGCGGRRPRR